MPNDFYGSTVVDGKLRYSSVSQIRKADHRTKGGCMRRWAYDKVFKINEPSTDKLEKSKTDGIDLDVEAKHYLRTGDTTALSALAMKGLHILPLPGADLGLDIKMHRIKYVLNGVDLAGPFTYDNKPPDGTIITVTSALTAAGVPVVGELDVCHNRGTNRGDEDDEAGIDPEGTVEVLDIKRKGVAQDRYKNPTYFSPSELVHDIQMGGYGEWVGRVFPPAQRVRLSHAYFFAKGKPPTKVTKLHVLDDCRQTWNYAESVVRQMQQVASEDNVHKVPFNLLACDMFAGCGYRQQCSAYRARQETVLYGKIADDFVNHPVGADAPVGRKDEEGKSSEVRGAQGASACSGTQAQTSTHTGSNPTGARGWGEAQGTPGLEHSGYASRQLPHVADDVPRNDLLPGRALQNLPYAVFEGQQGRTAERGPLSQDGQGSWNTVPPLQRLVGHSEGQSGHARQSDWLSQGDKQVGILANNNLLPQQQQVVAAGGPVQQAMPATGVMPQAQVQPDMRAQLEAETAQMRAQQQVQQQMTQPSLIEAWARIEKHGRGTPALGGNAAQAYASAKGYGPISPGAGYSGTGQLAGIQLMEPSHIFQLLGELDGQAPQQAPVPQPQQIVYTQPVVNAVANLGPAQPMTPPATVQQQPMQQALVGGTVGMQILAPNAPESQPQLAMQQPAPQAQAPQAQTTPPAETAQTEAPKKKRGRPANKDAATNPPVATAAGSSPESHASGGGSVGTTEVLVEETMVFIDCIPNRPYTTLTKYIDDLNHDLAKRYSVNEKGEPGVQDVRCVPKNSVLAYGAWKGAVYECVLAKPPAPGILYVDTRSSEIAQVVGDALTTLCEREGILCVKG